MKKIMVAAGMIAGAATVCKVIKAIRNENHRLKHENASLEECARTDELTGLRNRYALREDFESFKGQIVGVAIMDIDGFKKFNDVHGHEYGDEVLRNVANELDIQVDEGVCYRYGGDEFLVISYEDVEFLENEMEELSYLLEADDDAISISYGTSEGKVRTHEDLRKLIHRADEALYDVKVKKGCGR